MWHGAADGDCGLVAIHIASITPQRSKPQPSLRKRAWRFLLNLAAMAMVVSVIPAAVVLAMRAALAVAR